MQIHEIIKSVKLAPAEKSVIQKCDDKLKMLTDLEAVIRTPSVANQYGVSSQLWDKVCETGAAFEANPTLENFEAHVAVVQRIEFLERHTQEFADLGCRARDTAKGSLAGVVEGIISRSLAELNKQANDRRAAAESAGMAAEFEIHHDNLRMALEAERGNGSPSGWLADHGFI